MALLPHPSLGLAIGDPDRNVLPPSTLPTKEELDRAMGPLILSASGWRKVFVPSGNEDSLAEEVGKADLALCAGMAACFADFLRARGAPALAVGIDTRPTGPLIAETMLRAFLAKGLEPRYLYIVAAPEIMAYARAEGLPFCYVSASHNPPGHNGVKFGLADGGVVGGRDSAELIAAFRALAAREGFAAEMAALCAAAGRPAVARVLTESVQGWKRRAASAYILFSREVIAGAEDRPAQEAAFDELQAALAERPLGVLAEFNGSARCLSIDADFIQCAGLAFRAANERPRAFAHRIVPEGSSLDLARGLLEEAHAADERFELAYVPDCDGDRGNLVFFDAGEGRARALAAQEVFALACVAELACMVRSGALGHDARGNAQQKVALVVNDPTSMRVDAIAARFDVDVYRAEVGEANVVGLARELRGRGYAVRVLGEGSNGGLIVHPSAVRDPLDTLFALVKLLRLPDAPGRPGPYRIWLELAGQIAVYRKDYSLAEVLSSLPPYATTSAFEEEAALRISSRDHAALKGRYQAIFRREWERKGPALRERYGYADWEAVANNGTAERKGLEDFAESGTGGLKILFKDEGQRPVAFIWMRGSGTEPVFRILADASGPRAAQAERELLAWQTAMIREADMGGA